MRDKYVDVFVDEVGNISMDANGFSGGQCLNETKKLEQALGTVVDRTSKPAMKERELIQKNRSVQRN